MNKLPHLLRQVAERAGMEAALQLARARGGRRLYVPETPTPHFIGAVGHGAAVALSELYPNEYVVVPLGPTGACYNAARIADEAIARDLSTPEIARLSGLTERTIWRRKARRGRARETRQRGLFED